MLRNICVCSQSPSYVHLFATPWAAACQAPLSMEFSRQGYWSGWPFPPPGDLPNPRTEHSSPASPSLAARFLYHSYTTDGTDK